MNTVHTAVNSRRLIKPRSDATTTIRTGDETILTEPLTAGIADFHMCAILVAPGATNRARLAYEFIDAFAIQHCIRYKMATALPDAAVAAFGHAGVANSVAANRTSIDMFGAGALAASPAHFAALIAALLAADGTRLYATRAAYDLETRSALLYTFIARNMPVLVQGDISRLLAASMATWPFDHT